VKNASIDRGMLSMVLLSRRLLLNANVTNCECFAISADDSRNKFATRPARCFFSALLASQSAAILLPSLLNIAWQQRELFNLGKVKFEKCDCC